MDANSVRNMHSIIAVTNKHTGKLHHVGSLYILTYDARKIKHKRNQAIPHPTHPVFKISLINKLIVMPIRVYAKWSLQFRYTDYNVVSNPQSYPCVRAPCRHAQGPVLYRNMILNDVGFSCPCPNLRLGHHATSAVLLPTFRCLRSASSALSLVTRHTVLTRTRFVNLRILALQKRNFLVSCDRFRGFEN
jgi:hypothetical protein